MVDFTGNAEMYVLPIAGYTVKGPYQRIAEIGPFQLFLPQEPKSRIFGATFSVYTQEKEEFRSWFSLNLWQCTVNDLYTVGSNKITEQIFTYYQREYNLWHQVPPYKPIPDEPTQLTPEQVSNWRTTLANMRESQQQLVERLALLDSLYEFQQHAKWYATGHINGDLQQYFRQELGLAHTFPITRTPLHQIFTVGSLRQIWGPFTVWDISYPARSGGYTKMTPANPYCLVRLGEEDIHFLSDREVSRYVDVEQRIRVSLLMYTNTLMLQKSRHASLIAKDPLSAERDSLEDEIERHEQFCRRLHVAWQQLQVMDLSESAEE